MRRNTAHEISIDRVSGTVKVMFSDAIIAVSDRALVLREAGREPVYYLPFADIHFEFLERSQSCRECPPKGVASYWSVSAPGGASSDVMWAYEETFEGFGALQAHGAFSPEKVVIEFFPEPETVTSSPSHRSG